MEPNHANARATRRGIALALLLAAAAGCAGKGKRFQDPDMDFGSVQTVAILPFQNLSRDQLAGERVRDVFSNMLLASGAFYVMPPGEVLRVVGRAGVQTPTVPSVEDVQKLGKQLQAQAVITGVVREYGEVRSGSASSNVIAVSAQMIETETGKVVWSGASTRGGVTFWMRLFGTGGTPMNALTEEAVDDLLDQLFEE